MRTATITLLLLAFLLVPAGTALADEDGGKEAEKPKAVTPLQKLIKEIKALVAREKAKPENDAKLLTDLEKLLESFEKMKPEPVKLADLSEEDREKLKKEVREEMAAERDAGGGGGGRGDWAERERNRRVGRALEGIDLKEGQREKVEEMLGEFMADSFTAYGNRDYGMVNDLKKDLEKRLKRVVGNKKARDIINNVNRQLPGRRGR